MPYNQTETKVCNVCGVDPQTLLSAVEYLNSFGGK